MEGKCYKFCFSSIIIKTVFFLFWAVNQIYKILKFPKVIKIMKPNALFLLIVVFAFQTFCGKTSLVITKTVSFVLLQRYRRGFIFSKDTVFLF